jgi:hypothetical protein
MDTFGDECVTCNANTPCDEEFESCSGLPSSDVGGGGGACTDQDEGIWSSSSSVDDDDDDVGVAHGRIMTMFVYCATINGGQCILNSTCVGDCLLTFFGYTRDCSTCFGESASCGVDNGCAMTW